MDFERMRHKIWADFINQISPLGAYTTTIVVLVTLYLTELRSEAIFILIGTVTITAIAIPMRLVFFKVRPDPIPYTNVLEKIRAGGMPSVHSARTAFLLMFFAYFFKGRFEAIMFLTAIAILIWYSRIYRRRHYPFDVLVGVILGFVVFKLVAMVYPIAMLS